MARPSNRAPKTRPLAPVHELNFRVHRSGRTVDTSPERRKSNAPRRPLPIADDEGRFDVPDVYMPPVTLPRSKSPASGRRTSSPFKIHIPSSDDDSDIDIKTEVDDMETHFEPQPYVESPRGGPRLQRGFQLPPSGFPLRGRSFLRGSWPTADPQPSSSAGPVAQEQYQGLEDLLRDEYFVKTKRSLRNIPENLRPKPVSQREVQRRLREERQHRRTSSPVRPALRLQRPQASSTEEAIRDVRHQLLSPLRELSPLTDCGDTGRAVNWPDKLEDGRLEEPSTMVFSAKLEEDWVDRGLTPSDWSRLG